jgi:hypothetical protein
MIRRMVVFALISLYPKFLSGASGKRLGTHASSVPGFLNRSLMETQHAGSVRTQALAISSERYPAA